MKNKIQPLESKVNAYFDNFDELNNRRSAWNTETKKLIHDTLTTINDNFTKLVWYIGKNEEVKNLESVYWSMGNEFAGIQINKKHISRRPGYLNFAQLITGKIIVIVSYPTIEENLRPEISPKVLGEYLPTEITEELIIEKAGLFLDEINDWTMNLDK